MAFAISIQEGVCATEDIRRVMEMVTRVCVEIVDLGLCLQRSMRQNNATVVGLPVWLRKLHLLFQTPIRRCNCVAPHPVHAQVRYTQVDSVGRDRARKEDGWRERTNYM